MFRNILIVCIGNICRSPMAEGLFKSTLKDQKKLDYNINSAGLAALVGHKADANATQLMEQKGIDISDHRACQIHSEMALKSDLILVMEQEQKSVIIQKYPVTRGKVFRLGEWGEFDIMDPYKKGLSAFEQSLGLIEKGMYQWLGKL